MHKKQNQFHPSGIKWPTEVDMALNKTQTRLKSGPPSSFLLLDSNPTVGDTLSIF